MDSLPLTPRCTESSGPPCDRLFADPVTGLADRNRWPTHICPFVAYASTLIWAGERARSLYGDDVPGAVVAWIGTYPLPVGRWSLPAGVPEGLAPLPGEGKAAIVLAPRMPFMEAHGFGIVDDHPLVAAAFNGDHDLLPVAMQFMIAGWSGEADTFRDQAARWWSTMSGIPVTGRPPGSTRHTIDDYKRIFALVSARLGRPPASLDEVHPACP